MSGDRLVVRRYAPADATQLHEAILDSLEHLTPWMPWAALEPLDLADREKLIADWKERWQTGEDFNFGVFENGRLVGGCGLHRRIGPGGLEIGYWTAPERPGVESPGRLPAVSSMGRSRCHESDTSKCAMTWPMSPAVVSPSGSGSASSRSERTVLRLQRRSEWYASGDSTATGGTRSEPGAQPDGSRHTTTASANASRTSEGVVALV